MAVIVKMMMVSVIVMIIRTQWLATLPWPLGNGLLYSAGSRVLLIKGSDTISRTWKQRLVSISAPPPLRLVEVVLKIHEAAKQVFV